MRLRFAVGPRYAPLYWGIGHILHLRGWFQKAFPIAMEGDVDGALCSRIAESADIGPVYLSDWLEHDEHTITIWHTGAAPFQLAASKPEPYLSVQFNNKLPHCCGVNHCP